MTYVDDFQADDAVLVRLHLHEQIDRSAIQLRTQFLRTRPQHAHSSAGRVLQSELAAILGEVTRAGDGDVADHKQRLRVAGAERLQHFVRGDELAIDLRQRQRRVDVRFATKHRFIESREAFVQALTERWKVLRVEGKAAGELVAAEVREELVHRIELVYCAELT